MWGSKPPVNNPVLLIVKSPEKARVLRKLLDPAHVYVVEVGSSVCGMKFSAILNTVRVSDYYSEVDKMLFEQWMENISIRLDLAHKDQHLNTVHHLFDLV